MRNQLVFCLFGLFLAFGCAQKQPNNVPPHVAPKLQNPSDEQCKTFAVNLKKALEENDTAAFGRLVDIDALIERAIGDITDAPKSKKGFIQGAKKSFASGAGIQLAINKSLQEGGDYRLIRIHEKDGQKWVLFRLASGDGNVNYHDYLVNKEPDGTVRAVDFFIFYTGEMMSATVRQAYLPLAAEESKSLFDRLTGEENEFVKNIQSFSKMNEASLKNDFQTAWNIYQSFPPTLKKNRLTMMLSLQIAQKIGEDEYQNLLASFKAAYPGDPCLDFILIDYYFSKKEYDQEIASISRIDKKLGGDAHLKWLWANTLLIQNKNAEARKIAKEAVDIEDDFAPAYETLLSISFAEKDFDESVRLLDKINEKFDDQYQSLEETATNAEFLASPQYREWKEKQEKK